MHLHTALITDAFTHPASPLLTFAMTSPNHLFTLSHCALLSHGVVDRMSRFKKLRLTATHPRIAFTGSTSLELPPHGLRVKNLSKKYSRLHGMRLTTAYPRAHHQLIKTLSFISDSNFPSHRLHHKLMLRFTFAKRLQHALSHCASLELTPTLCQVPSHCSHQGTCALPLS